MVKEKSFWQKVYDEYYASNVSRPIQELISEYNGLVASEVYFQSVTARLTATVDLLRMRGYDLSAIIRENRLRLVKIKIVDHQVLPLLRRDTE